MGGAGGGCLINIRSCNVAFATRHCCAYSHHLYDPFPPSSSPLRLLLLPPLNCSGCGWTLPSPCPCASASPQASALATGGRCNFPLVRISLASQHNMAWETTSSKLERLNVHHCCVCSEAKRPDPPPLPTLSTRSAVAVSGVFDAITAALHLQRACPLGKCMQLAACPELSTAPAPLTRACSCLP